LAIVRSEGMPVLEIGLAGLVRKFMSARTFLLDLSCTASALSFDCRYYLNWTISVAFPMVSVTYIGALFAGRFMFNEPVNLARAVGVLLICSRVIFVIRSQ
jgi:multidrug transporter EmrE-like cation transporter